MNRHIGNMAPEAAVEGRTPNLLNKMALSAAETGAGSSTFQRFLVEEVLFDPMELDEKRVENLKSRFEITDAAFLKLVPANTVIARAINHAASAHERFHYLFPFFPPHLMLPVKAGEHVWAFFETEKLIDHGFWVCRISEPRHVDDVNHTHADRKYHSSERTTSLSERFDGTQGSTPSFENGPTVSQNGREVQIGASASSLDTDPKAYEKLLRDSDSARTVSMESVPRYRKRPGDHVIQGSNNALIALGTDRSGRTAKFSDTEDGKRVTGKIDNDQDGEAGTIDVVAGRGRGAKTSGKTATNTLGKQEVSKRVADESPSEGDPDFELDASRVYVSMKTDADGHFAINFSDKAEAGSPAVIIKTDHVRIVARKSLKFVLQPTWNAPESECAGILIKDGNVVFVPSTTGYVKLGGEDAAGVPLLQPAAVQANGQVSGPPLVSTLGSQIGLGGANGSFASKVLIK